MLKYPKVPKVKKPKKKGKTERQKLVDDCDELTRKVLRATRPRFCVTCGRPETPDHPLQVGHWIKRGRWFVRWDLRNVNPQCPGCNLRHNHFTFYYDSWMLDTYGESTVKELMTLAKQSQKITLKQLKEIKESLCETLTKSR
jgi:hypothetical protein